MPRPGQCSSTHGPRTGADGLGAVTLTGAPRAAEGRPRPCRRTSVRRRSTSGRRSNPASSGTARRTLPCRPNDLHRRPHASVSRAASGGGGGGRTARCLTPAPGGRGRCTPQHRWPQRRGPRHDRAEGVIPSRRGWRPRPRRQRARMPRAILVPVSGGGGPAASRGQGRRRGPRGHGPRSLSTHGRHLFRPRDATAASEPRRQRHRGRCAPTQVPAPHGPCADPRVRARRQASGSVSLPEPTEPCSSVHGGPRAGAWAAELVDRGQVREQQRVRAQDEAAPQH